MNQSENQSDRATPDDLAWLEREAAVHEQWAAHHEAYPAPAQAEQERERARFYRRILNSLRAPAATEQEPSAWRIEGEETDDEWSEVRAFDYMTDDAGVAEESAADGHTVTPLYAAPPALVVQQQPRAWECACGGVMPWRYNVCSECGEMVRADCAATPLYALKEMKVSES